MAKKIKDQPTSMLIHAQQIIQMGSEQLYSFFGQVEKDFKENLVSTTYKEKVEADLRARVLKNNEIVTDLDREIFSRIERDFGGTTPKYVPFLMSNYNKEKAAHSETIKLKPKASTDKDPIKLKTSKEKRV